MGDDWTSATLLDVDEICDLVDALPERVRNQTGRPVVESLLRGTAPRTSWLARSGSKLDAWCWALHSPGEGVVRGVVHVRPGGENAALLHDGWARLLAWSEELVPRPDVVRTGTSPDDAAGVAALETLGFQPARAMWSMRAATPARPPGARPGPDGLTITAEADPQRVHAVMEEGFAGHWGYAPVGPDEFIAFRQDVGGYAPELWFLAELDGRTVGAMILDLGRQERGAMWLLELAVVPGARKWGVATALIRGAFEAATERGLPWVELFVDTENVDDAPRLYRELGFEVVDANLVLARPMPPPS